MAGLFVCPLIESAHRGMTEIDVACWFLKGVWVAFLGLAAFVVPVVVAMCLQPLDGSAIRRWRRGP